MADYIGRYRLLRLLMTGQSSQIWEAIDDNTGQHYALKHLLPEQETNREQISYLKHEYEVGSSLDHPRIIKMHELFYIKGVPNLLMEFYPHLNLKQRLTSEGYETLLPKAREIILACADALSYFHKQGWTHRDIKPDNYLVSSEGEIKLIDFALAQKKKSGLAKLFGGKSKVQGTRSYMSPEQIRGASIDHRSDIYSFGCMVFEVLSGKMPFVGVSANDLLQKHLTAPPPSLEIVNPNVTNDFSRLMMRCMAKKPEERPESMARLLIEMKALKMFKRNPAATAG